MDTTRLVWFQIEYELYLKIFHNLLAYLPLYP